VVTKDYLGNKVTVLHYEISDGKRVREYPDGSMLIEMRPGRFRNFEAGHWMCEMALGRTLQDSPIARAIYRLKDARRSHKAGTHEPVTYYVDREGKIGVPPEPGMQPPDNVTVHTADNLREIDRLSAKMQDQMYREFQDDGVATEYFDQVTGWDRSQMLDAMQHGRGRKEREIARLMLEDVDQEAANRQKISTRAMFHWREHDR